MKRFLTIFFSVFVCGAVAVAAFNVFADPYVLFQWVRVDGVNTGQTGKEYRFVNNVKPLRVRFGNPDTVFVGTSRTNQGFDPDRLGPCDLGKSYNLGLSGLHNRDIFGLAGFAMAYGTPKRLFVELDFRGAMKSHDRSSKLPSRLMDFRWPFDAMANILFSRLTLAHSAEKLYVNLAGSARRGGIRPNGWRDRESYRPAAFHLDGWYLAKADNEVDSWRDYLAYGGTSNVDAHLERMAPDFENLDRLLTEADEHDVQIVLFIPPSHFAKFEMFRREGHWPSFEAWKRGLAGIAARHGVALWDFADYSPVASYRAQETANPHFIDIDHFTSVVGRSMVTRMCGTADQAVAERLVWGVRLDRVDVDTHLAAVRQRAAAFARETSTDP